MVTNSFFCFPLQILHFTGVCMGAFKGMLVCRVQFVSCPQYLHVSSQYSCSTCGSFGAWQRRGSMGLYHRFLWSAVVCTSMCRTGLAKVENRFSWLDTSWPWVCEFVKWELSAGNSGRGIICRTQSDYYRVRGAGPQLEVKLSVCVL